MGHFQRVVLILGVLAAVGAEPEPQRNNEYLPPDKGYNYDRPKIPFPSNPPSTQYRPPPQQQSPPPPSYRPPSRPITSPPRPPPTYGTPAPTYNRPPPPPPPPSFAPPRPTYGPPPPQDTYRPPPTPAPRPPPYNPAPSGPAADHSHDHSHGDHVHEPGMPYDFNYAVRADETGVDFSQNEVSDGDQVKGEYRVQLPDGRLQIVRYTADWKTGFHADVTYEGEAKYPDFVPNASGSNQVIADRPSGGYSYPRPGQTNPPNSYAPPSTGGPY